MRVLCLCSVVKQRPGAETEIDPVAMVRIKASINREKTIHKDNINEKPKKQT